MLDEDFGLTDEADALRLAVGNRRQILQRAEKFRQRRRQAGIVGFVKHFLHGRQVGTARARESVIAVRLEQLKVEKAVLHGPDFGDADAASEQHAADIDRQRRIVHDLVA
ncbi:MAG: hypothetical protein M5R36_29035 [Deltaproteobacteria bacterium]|nr:hypothetical protein [Deltaproteobacteria bacterium]